MNNVGGSSAPGGGVLALDDDDWQDTINANLFAAVRLDRAFLPGMLKQGSGVILHISSIQRRLPLFEGGTFLIEQAKLDASDVRSQVITGAGHWLMEEAPKMVIPAIREFVA